MRNILINDDANSSSLPKYINLNCKNEVREIPYDTCGKLVNFTRNSLFPSLSHSCTEDTKLKKITPEDPCENDIFIVVTAR